ncbi:hypothetical protein GHT06_019827 [Daphnia sinensis]|uniref:Reelin domain-containing protein n=1 Tax=Daphnia sinensis TaxID=1820382 RepID=A0AAD5KKM0_9CRUS|nr:hypothetical protein GHT06_019827 [Daphnia sinensis]
MAIKAICTLVTLFLIFENCRAFPNGGPIDACVKAQPNRPNHGGTQPQPENTNPFIVEASNDYYRPGDKITVTIRGPKSAFKGFFFQGRDPKTQEWIGVFEKNPDAKSYVECSAATHTDNDPKESVTLLWHAPDATGSVYFVGTVLQNYRTYWSDVVARVPQ